MLKKNQPSPEEKIEQRQVIELAIRRQLITFLIEQLPKLLISSSLFIGGIILLFLRIPGWSLIIGLPAVQIGLVFLIFNYDRITNQKVGIGSLYSFECQKCRKTFLSFQQDQEKICPYCEAKHNLEN